MNGCQTWPPGPTTPPASSCPFRICPSRGDVTGVVPPLPGATGTDLLIKRWSGRTGGYQLFGALRQAWVRHASERHVLVCRPRSRLWLHAAEAPENGELMFTGTCEALHRGGIEALQRLQSDAFTCRWCLGIPELGRVEAEFAVSAGPATQRSGQLRLCRLEFSLSGALTFRSD